MVSHLETLHDAERHDPMLVVWGEQCMAAVTAVTVAGAVATLTVDAPMPMGAATRSRDGVLSLAKLADVLRQGITRVIVTSDRTPRQTVVASSTHRLAVGYGHGRWHTLFTDGVSGGVAGEN
jgi:hypothetical protein